MNVFTPEYETDFSMDWLKGNAPVYHIFRRLQQLGKGYRNSVTIHWQVEYEAARCHLKYETKNIEEQSVTAPGKSSDSSGQDSPQKLCLSDVKSWKEYIYIIMYMYFCRSMRTLWFRGDELFISCINFFQICISGFTIHCITQYLLKCTCSSTCQSFRMTGCRRMSILDASFVNVTVLHSFHWLFISLSLIVRKYEWICEEKNKYCLYIFTFDIYSICHWKHLVWKDLFWTIIFWIVDSQHRYIDLMISLYTYM